MSMVRRLIEAKSREREKEKELRKRETPKPKKEIRALPAASLWLSCSSWHVSALVCILLALFLLASQRPNCLPA